MLSERIQDKVSSRHCCRTRMTCLCVRTVVVVVGQQHSTSAFQHYCICRAVYARRSKQTVAGAPRCPSPCAWREQKQTRAAAAVSADRTARLLPRRQCGAGSGCRQWLQAEQHEFAARHGGDIVKAYTEQRHGVLWVGHLILKARSKGGTGHPQDMGWREYTSL